MNEAQWLAGSDPEEMVKFLHEQGHERKLRLFGCACSRRVWKQLREKCFRNAVEVAERFADGQAGAKELNAAKLEAGRKLEQLSSKGLQGAPYNARATAWSTTRNHGSAAMYPLWVLTTKKERNWQVALLHDIFGNPFQPVQFDPAWRTEAVMSAARRIYEGRDFSKMAPLSAALRKAGCDDREIIAHFRRRRHVRGCWVVDLVLDRA